MLSTSDYRKILDIIDIAYSLPNHTEMFQAVFAKLDKLIGVNSSAFIPWDTSVSKFEFRGNVVFNTSAQALRVYLAHFSTIDPYLETGSHLENPLNTAVKITDFMPVSRYVETRYAREFAPLIPCFYEMNAMIGCQGDPIGAIALHRKRRERDFKERDRTIMNLLLPHLARALHHIALMETSALSQQAGIVVVGSEGHPIFMNQEARRILNGKPLKLIPEPGKGTDPAFFKTEAGLYRVRTTPIRWSTAEKIIILEPYPPESEFSKLLPEYGLTRRQQEITLWAIWGLSNREIAEHLFITEQTVKDHLHEVFGKIKIRRRTELAAKVLGLSADAPS